MLCIVLFQFYALGSVAGRLRVVPSFVLTRCARRSPFLAWGDFHARARFARSTILEEKWGTNRIHVVGRAE